MRSIEFSERMAGTYVGNDGRQAPMMFEVDAVAPGPQSFVVGTPIQLRGTMTIGGIARTVPTHGQLTVRLFRLGKRELVYELSFTDDDGNQCRYEARKDISLIRPLSTMTTLRGHVYRAAEPIGTATVHFDLKDIPGFLSSFGLRTRV